MVGAESVYCHFKRSEKSRGSKEPDFSLQRTLLEMTLCLLKHCTIVQSVTKFSSNDDAKRQWKAAFFCFQLARKVGDGNGWMVYE